jgi:hypothetical protein
MPENADARRATTYSWYIAFFLMACNTCFAAALAVPALDLQLALLAPARFFLAMPIGCIYASLPLILPNQIRGQIALLGTSLALTVAAASFLSAALFRASWRPCRRDYALMHGEA